MLSTKPLLILLLILLTSILVTLINAEGGFENLAAIIDRSRQEFDQLKAALPSQKTARPTVTPPLNLAQFSHGACTADTDCQPAGCSDHICSSDPSLITTCEYNPDYPSDKTHTCGCRDSRCAWSTK